MWVTWWMVDASIAAFEYTQDTPRRAPIFRRIDHIVVLAWEGGSSDCRPNRELIESRTRYMVSVWRRQRDQAVFRRMVMMVVVMAEVGKSTLHRYGLLADHKSCMYALRGEAFPPTVAEHIDRLHTPHPSLLPLPYIYYK